MAMTLASFRGTKTPGALDDAAENRATLESQKLEIEKQLAADDERIALARRKALVEELKTLFLPDAPILRDLESQIKNEKFDAEERQMLRVQYAKLNSNATCRRPENQQSPRSGSPRINADGTRGNRQ